MQATRFLLRERIVKLHQSGYSIQSISDELQVCYSTVRILLRRYQQKGDSGLHPLYKHCGRPSPTRKDVVYRAALWLKRLHQHWGTPRIHLGLQSRYKTSTPRIRTLNRWFKDANLNKPRSKVSRVIIGKSTAVHNIWQLDAKENITLADGQKACYLTVVDEKVELVGPPMRLASLLFPYGRVCQVPLDEFRQGLINVFHRWGKCGAMRVDNGEPLGSPQHNTTSALALWLIGIDIDMIFNKPGCPQANAKVERMQDISARWADLHKAQNIIQLQKNLDKESVLQRTLFPVSRLNNQTRIATFPELETSRRIFDKDFFDQKRVYQYLAKKTYVRNISSSGQIVHFGHRYSVGIAHKNQSVEIKLDMTKLVWTIYLKNQIIKEIKPDNLTKEKIQNMTVYVKELKNDKS